MIDMLQYIPWEVRKSEVLNKYFELINELFEEYENDIKSNSHLAIIDKLSGERLNRYASRFTIFRLESWSDEALRRVVKMRRFIYDRNLGIVENLNDLMRAATGYDVLVERNGISGELDVTAIIQPDLPNDLMQEFDNFWVFGCKLNTSVKEIGFAIYETFGDLPHCNNTGVQDFPIAFEAVTNSGVAGFAIYETFGDLPFCSNTGFEDFPLRTDFLELG